LNEEWSVVADQPTAVGLSNAEYLRLSGTIQATLATLGVAIHPASRLAAYDEAIASLVRFRFGSADVPEKRLRVAARAVTELWQLAVIAALLRSAEPNSGLRAKVRTLLEDAALPGTEAGRPSPGRDVQFELFVAASWSTAGMPCALREPPGPDLTLALGRSEIALEVKRIKSTTSLQSRMKDADHQIALSPGGGVVVTDVSPALTGERLYLTAGSPREALADLERRLKSLMVVKLDAVRRRVDPTRTFGWVGYGQALYLFGDAPPLIVYQWKNFNLGSGRDERWLALVAAFSRLVRVPEMAITASVDDRAWH
jgi:hypothetical protein